MWLNLKQMRGAQERVERTYDPAAFGPPDEAFSVVAPVGLWLDVHKKGPQFRLVGRVATTLQFRCVRCLETFVRAFDEEFDLLYLPHSENVGEGELEVEEDDLTAAFYRDDKIDLGQLMRERFYLALPMKPLCSETCRGLCPNCGINLNTDTCGCAAGWQDPRLADLRSLLPKDQ